MKTVTRRHFLATTAAALPAAAQSAPSTRDGWIDAHVHVWSPDTEAYPLAKGYKKENMKPANFTPEELLALANPAGVSRIVLIQMSFYRFDNRYMLDTMAKFPGVFGGVAVIDENGPDPAAEMRELNARGVRGFRVRANEETIGAWPKAEGLKQMWKTAAETGQAICCLATPAAFPAIRGMCEAFPKTPVVIDHFGRVGSKGTTIVDSELENLCRLSEFKTVSVKVSAFYALGKKLPPYDDLAPMIRRLRDSFGSDRLMWATDCPFQVQNGHTYGESITLIRDRLDFLSDDDKTRMLRTTADRVFFG
jgi:predicted TIM-barrel fold metal-dependent hydrolase